MNDMIGIRGGIGVQWLNIDVGSSNLKCDIYKYEFHPLSRNQSCPAGQQCEYRVFYQHTASGGYNDSYYGYFSDSDEPIVALKTQKFDWEYNEPFFANLGFVIGDDWAGKFDYLKEYCDVVYLPRTNGISTTFIKNKLGNENEKN